MRPLFVAFAFLLFAPFARGQYTYFTATIPFTPANPTGAPSTGSGSRLRMDQPTRRFWVWNETSLTWVRLAQGIDKMATCAAPAYVPVVGQSDFVVNECAIPELYQHTGGGTWICLNCTGGGGAINTDATLDGDGSGGDLLRIAQQGATTSKVLSWTGTTWEPSWGTPYLYVTTGQTVTSAVNEILIGTVGADVTFGLPSCNAALDAKHFKFIRNGSDGFSITIDPSASETFYDGTLKKISYGKLSIDCYCRFSGGVGTWFFDNF